MCMCVCKNIFKKGIYKEQNYVSKCNGIEDIEKHLWNYLPFIVLELWFPRKLTQQ